VTSIRLGLELLSEQTNQKLDSEEKQMLSLAIRNTRRLEGLVNDIMDYSKIAAGKMMVDRDACVARGLVDEAIDVMKAAATARGIKIIKDVSPLLPRLHADGRRIIQVLTNLLSNAIKFTPTRGNIHVSVSEGRFEHEGTLMFRVKDNGCGISADQLENIFSMFEQGGMNSVRSCEGTGLGLTLSRAMIELHGGRIWAESWKGSGATICFTVPISQQDLSRPQNAYAQPIKIHGLLAEVARRFNAFLALVV
jgi:signal transduction histidine kinase